MQSSSVARKSWIDLVAPAYYIVVVSELCLRDPTQIQVHKVLATDRKSQICDPVGGLPACMP